jgi:hypothetical protein
MPSGSWLYEVKGSLLVVPVFQPAQLRAASVSLGLDGGFAKVMPNSVEPGGMEVASSEVMSTNTELLGERVVFLHGHLQRLRRWRYPLPPGPGQSSRAMIVWDSDDEPDLFQVVTEEEAHHSYQ